MYVIDQNLMNRIVMVVGQNQNAFGKLNAGEIREAVKLVINALVSEIFGEEHQPMKTEYAVKTTKKGAVKKSKPKPKPKAK
jgi:hypothetical protein